MYYTDIFTQLRETLITDRNMYNAFVFSIKSVLDDKGINGIDSRELARCITDKIIGIN